MVSLDAVSLPSLAGRWWEAVASPDLRAAAATAGSPLVGLVPVGATEQHGPHLPTGTDTIVAAALCAAASRQAPAVVLPPIPVGASTFHGRRLAGTLALPSTVLIQLAQAYADWAVSSGIDRLLFVNGHVGNRAALDVATDELRHHRPDLRVGAVSWWTLTPAIEREVTADAEDWHANRAETALMLAIAPELVHLDRLAEADDPDRSAGLVFRYGVDRMSRTGATGTPSAATPELGHELLDAAVAALTTTVLRAAEEEPPLAP